VFSFVSFKKAQLLELRGTKPKQKRERKKNSTPKTQKITQNIKKSKENFTN